jgi:hypothetical protein
MYFSIVNLASFQSERICLREDQPRIHFEIDFLLPPLLLSNLQLLIMVSSAKEPLLAKVEHHHHAKILLLI